MKIMFDLRPVTKLYSLTFLDPIKTLKQLYTSCKHFQRSIGRFWFKTKRTISTQRNTGTFSSYVRRNSIKHQCQRWSFFFILFMSKSKFWLYKCFRWAHRIEFIYKKYLRKHNLELFDARNIYICPLFVAFALRVSV